MDCLVCCRTADFLLFFFFFCFVFFCFLFFFRRFSKIQVKIPRKCHNHILQPSRSTKRRRDEEQIKTTQTQHMKPQTHYETKKNCNRETALERSVGKLLGGVGGVGGSGGLNQFYSRETSSLVLMQLQITNICSICVRIMKTRLFKYTENFTTNHQKNENFQIKFSNIFHISAQNIDCGYSLEPPRRGGSNEYPQSMFLSRNKKNNVYPCKPQFYYIKVGFKGVKIIKACFRYGSLETCLTHWQSRFTC